MKSLLWGVVVLALVLGWGWWKLGGTFSRNAASGGSPRAASQSPANMHQLLASSPAQIAGCDIALLNLLCAEGLPGAEKLNPQDCLATLDGWAERVRTETERHLYRYRANLREFESSEDYFRMLMMAVVLYEDFSVRYNPERMNTPGNLDASDHFFVDSRDVFLHGLLGRAGVQSLESKVQGLNSPSPNPLPEKRVTALRPALNSQPSTLNSQPPTRHLQFHAGALYRHWATPGLPAEAGHHEVTLVHPVGKRGGAVRPGGYRQRHEPLR